MLTPEHIFKMAKSKERRIGIGSLPESEKVLTSVKLADAVGYGKTEVYYDSLELVMALKEGRIDAAVRGDLDSNISMRSIKDVFGLDRILRIAMVQPRGGNIFFLAPVGIDEGTNSIEKIEMVELAMPLLSKLGIEPKIGIMSGGRNSDLGRSAQVDKTIEEAEEIVAALKAKGYDAEDVQILIENAVQSKNLIIAPDGISGNLIFRCLHLVDGGRSMGAPVLNLKKVFIDTSRAKPSYVDSIALASALVGKNHSLIK
ncbi:MAG: methanogenesis marker protein Mmp4/MtxX [Methanomassiliicoccales archaeon]|nr:MAG: methanogenesis marker protein Mmp4/MtxX [Methanomassiliicoccales archaeon]